MYSHGPAPAGYDWPGQWGGPHRNTPAARRRRLLVPVFISLLIQVPPVFFSFANRQVTPTGIAHLDVLWHLLLALVGPVALLGARRFPGPVVIIVAAAASVDLFVGVATHGPPYASLAFAIVSAVARGARVWAWASVATAWVVCIVLEIFVGAEWKPIGIVLTTFGILIVFGVGESLRTRGERVAALMRARAQRQQSEVQAERVRIARELHDVLAHSLSQINVQAGVGLHLMDNQPDKAREALASIKETSKTALDEVRSVLGALRSEGGTDPEAPLVPEPDLSRIPGLAASVTSQGVEVTVVGVTHDVPKAMQLAMYRIVQESLTNVVRHANAKHAQVTFAQTADEYLITVLDDGTAGPGAGEDAGRGLLGMRERAELLGGSLTAGPRSDATGFQVSARIPCPADSRRDQADTAREAAAHE